MQSWHITDLLVYKFHLNLNAPICTTERTKMRACRSLRVFCACACVCARQGLYRSTERQADMMRSESQRLCEGGLTSAFSSASQDSSK